MAENLKEKFDSITSAYYTSKFNLRSPFWDSYYNIKDQELQKRLENDFLELKKNNPESIEMLVQEEYRNNFISLEPEKVVFLNK